MIGQYTMLSLVANAAGLDRAALTPGPRHPVRSAPMCKSLGGPAGRAGRSGGTRMTFTPLAPTVLSAPEQVAPETWILHSVQEATGAPLFVYLNSMVIRGSEPMIIDTSTPANREQFLEDVFGIVEPEDVKWVFLSHDDVDHTGNLEIVMDRCPNATLVSSWAITERHSNAFDFPLDRCRWINDGESWDAGDRTFRAVRPPLYDSPTTRGLFDETTGVYWAVDSFACPMAGGHRGVGRRLRGRALAQRHGDVHVPRAVAVAVDRRPEEVRGVGRTRAGRSVRPRWRSRTAR